MLRKSQLTKLSSSLAPPHPPVSRRGYGIADSGNPKWRGIDCSGCSFFRRDRHIFAQHRRQPEDWEIGKFVSLPWQVAVLPTTQAAMTALARIDSARRDRTSTSIVNLMELENAHVNEDAL